ELERARAEARAVEERRRLRVTRALAASILALVVGLGGGTAWYLQRQQRQAAQGALLGREVDVLLDQAGAHADDPARWRAALEAVRRVEVALGDGGRSADRRHAAALRGRAEGGLAAAEADRALVDRLVDIRGAQA